MVTYWTLSDGITTYTFEKNPDITGGTTGELGDEADIVDQYLSDRDGPYLARRHDKTVPASIQLTTLTESAYHNLRSWYQRDVTLVLTDDLGRTLHIFMTDLDLKRVRNAGAPWMHIATLTYLVMSTSGG